MYPSVSYSVPLDDVTIIHTIEPLVCSQNVSSVVPYWNLFLQVFDQANTYLRAFIPSQYVRDELGLYLHLHHLQCTSENTTQNVAEP